MEDSRRVWTFEIVERAETSPERVYAVLADLLRWPDWAPGVRRTTWERGADPALFGVGGIRKVGTRGFHVREEILAATPPHAQTYTILSGAPVKNHRGEVQMMPEQNGTRIVWRGSFTSKVPGTGRLVRRIARQNAARLARALAARAEVAP